MKIGIIELHYHAEFLNTLIQIFNKEQITVYTTHDIYKELPAEAKTKPTYVFKNPKESIKTFLRTIQTNDLDLLFVNTIQPSMIDLPSWIDFKPKCKSILTLHNLNAWYNNKFILRKNIFQTIDSYIASKNVNKVLNNFNIINVVYGPMAHTAWNYFPQNKIINIPFAYAQDKIESEQHETIWFTIPGVVSNLRRDYDIIFKLFKPLLKKYDIRLILLGKNEEKYIFEPNVGGEEKVTTFDYRVETETYNKYLRDTDFIIIPSVKTIHNMNAVDEVYGKTKSPNIHEAIKWRKPFITPNYIEIDKNLGKSSLQCVDESEFEEQLKLIIEDKDLLKDIKKKAIKDTESFTLKNIRKRIYKELEV